MKTELQRFIRKVSELQAEESEQLDETRFADIARELGMSDDDLEAASREAEKCLAKGIAFRRGELFDDAIAALQEARALAPFRNDITRELATAHLSRFKANGEEVDRVTADALLEQCIDRDADNDALYELLREARVERPRRGTRLRAWALAALSFVLGVGAVLGAQQILQPPPATTQPVVVTGPAPVVMRVDPLLGPAGQWVHMDGENFVPGKTTISVGGVDGIQPAQHSDTQMGFTVPAGATGTTTVKVTTPNGSGESYVEFTVGMPTHPPTVNAISPASGPPGEYVYISGTGMMNGHTTVTYGEVAGIQPVVYSPTSIAFSVPSDATTSSQITVTTPAGDATSTAVFRLLPPSR